MRNGGHVRIQSFDGQHLIIDVVGEAYHCVSLTSLDNFADTSEENERFLRFLDLN